MTDCKICEGRGWLNDTMPELMRGVMPGSQWEVMCKACDGTGVVGGVHYVEPDRPHDALCRWTLYNFRITRTSDSTQATCPACVEILADRTEEAVA